MLNISNDIYFNEDIPDYDSTKSLISHITSTNKSSVVIYPDNSVVTQIATTLFHYDYDYGYLNREDFHRRCSILIIGDTQKLISIFTKIKISAQYIYRSSLERRKAMIAKKYFADMSKDYNANLYWGDLYQKRYKKSLSQSEDHLDYKNYFPIAVGSECNYMLPRDYLGIRDSEQRPAFYITSDLNFFDKNPKLEFDYIIIDHSKIWKFVNIIPKQARIIHFFTSILNDKIPYSLSRNNYPLICLENSVPIIDENIDDKISVNVLESGYDEEMLKIYNYFKNIPQNSEYVYIKKLIGRFFSRILSCPVNAITYDETINLIPYGETFTELKNEIKRQPTLAMDKNILNCSDICETILNSADNYSIKEDNILRFAKEAITTGTNTVIIVSDEYSAQALSKRIYEILGIDIVDVESLSIIPIKSVNRLINKNKCEIVVLPFANGLSSFGNIFTITAHKYLVLLYPHEASLIAEKIDKIKEAVMNAEIIGMANSKVNDFINSISRKLKRYFRSSRKELLPSIEELIRFESSNLPSTLNTVKYTGENTVEARVINFDDGTFIMCEKSSPIDVFTVSGNSVESILPDNVVVGDKVLLINGSARESLYDLILKSLENVPAMRVNTLLIELWKNKLRNVAIYSGKKISEIYEDLHKMDFNKTYATMVGWFSGRVMGPNSLNDVLMLGKHLNINQFIDYGENIFAAMRTVRNINRLLAKKLNKAIVSANSTMATDELYDKYGISFEELKSAVDVKKVSHVLDEVVIIKRSELGICFNKNKAVG